MEPCSPCQSWLSAGSMESASGSAQPETTAGSGKRAFPSAIDSKVYRHPHSKRNASRTDHPKMSLTEDELPAPLLSEIEAGRAVLVLGAGASLSAMEACGVKPPLTGRQLAKLLAEKFLTDDQSSLPLPQVADLAINESDLFTVQDFIASLLVKVKPQQEHQIITTFRWRGLATTNYDTLIEQAYVANRDAVQAPVSMIDNGDRVDDLLRDPESVQLLKLHGCITRTHSETCPLLLSTAQF